MNQVWAKDQQPPGALLDQLIALLRAGQASVVAEEAGKLLQAYPASFPLWEIYGGCLLEMEQFEAAEMALAQGCALAPDQWEGLMNHATALRALGRLEAAEARARAAVERAPDEVPALLELCACVNALGRVEEGLALSERVLACDPRSAVGHQNRGAALLALGRRKQARRAFEAAVDKSPGFAEAHRNLAKLKRWEAPDAQLAQMLELYEDTGLSAEDRARVCFALFTAFDKLDDRDRAWRYLAEGNAIRKALAGYDPETDRRQLARAGALFSGLPQVQAAPAEVVPIFIVGMPRSGTTLAEQIVSAHGAVAAGGECPTLGQLAGALLERDGPVTAEDVVAVRAAYLRAARDIAGGAPFVTDKMPHNFRYLGLIAAALPEARIVHVTRQAEAVCWSNLRHYFVASGLGYTHDPEDTVAYFGRYRAAMAHWAGACAAPIRALDYEALVARPEEETRALVSDLGLPWDAACLHPEQNDRAVMTASMGQVRRRIYGGSSRAWTRYEPWLRVAFQPLRAYTDS